MITPEEEADDAWMWLERLRSSEPPTKRDAMEEAREIVGFDLSPDDQPSTLVIMDRIAHALRERDERLAEALKDCARVVAASDAALKMVGDALRKLHHTERGTCALNLRSDCEYCNILARLREPGERR